MPVQPPRYEVYTVIPRPAGSFQHRIGGRAAVDLVDHDRRGGGYGGDGRLRSDADGDEGEGDEEGEVAGEAVGDRGEQLLVGAGEGDERV